MAIQVDIVTPLQSAFSGDASEVMLPGWHGEMGILEGHDIVLALLRGGLTRVRTASGEQRFVTGRGFVEVGPNRVTLLTDSCTAVEALDKTQAAADLAAAVEALKKHAFDSKEHKAAMQTIELAKATLDA